MPILQGKYQWDSDANQPCQLLKKSDVSIFSPYGVSDFIFVGPKEIEGYYQEHAKEFSGKKLEAVEPPIRRILAAQKEAAKKKEYLTGLRSHAEIEINLPP